MGVQDEDKTIGSAAERAARFRQYEYKANASLVLQADKTERRMHEPSGMPESLWGRIDAKAFGDRVKTTNDDKIHAKKKKTKNAIDLKHSQDSDAFATSNTHKKRKKTGHKRDVLSSEMNFNSGYKPKTRETRAAYEVLLKSMTEQFGEQPSDVLRGAAEEVLETLKDTSVNEKKRKEEVESLVGELSEEKFAKLVAVGKMITDFTPAGQGEEGNPEYENGENEEMDDDVGVAVEFEESDEDDSDDDDDGDGGNRAELRELRSESEEEDSDDDKDEEEEDSDASDDSLGEPKKRHKKQHVIVRPSEIDAYYLQRLISNAFSGSSTATTEEEKENDQTKMSEIAEKALQALEAPDDRSRENELVRLLEYDKFDLVKTLMQNRDVILWCTKLSRAQSETEKQDIENLMSNDSNGALILSEMKATRASARERQENVENKIREEAKKLRLDAQKRREKELGASAHRKVLELDALAFHQGSRLMANAKFELPEGSFRTQKKGYEEVYVPAMKAPPFADNEKLRPIEEIPNGPAAFKGMKSLNRVQSRVYETALLSPENMLLSCQLGRGTNVAVLTICHEIGNTAIQTPARLI